MESHKRSIAKAISWRVIASLTTFSLVLITTKDLNLALGVGGLDVVLKMFFYYGHERVWNVVRWGRAVPA